jgi:hypothetical protein
VYKFSTLLNVHHNGGFLNKLNYNMKRVFLIALFAAGVGVISAFAQNTFEKSKKLSKDEVPVAVMQSFQKDFSNLEDKGSWKLHYTEKTENGKTVFTPEYYTFTGKNNGEKVELKFSTTGALASSKGVTQGSTN